MALGLLVKSNPIFKATPQVGKPTLASKPGAQALWLSGLKSFELLQGREEVPHKCCSPFTGHLSARSDTKDCAVFQQEREKVLNIANLR